jgi:hypothetical protein
MFQTGEIENYYSHMKYGYVRAKGAAKVLRFELSHVCDEILEEELQQGILKQRVKFSLISGALNPIVIRLRKCALNVTTDTGRSRYDVDVSHAGVLAALESERKCLESIQLQAATVQDYTDHYIIRVAEQCTRELYEIEDGWTVKAKKDEKDAYPWIAEITDVDYEARTIVISRLSGDAVPFSGEKFRAFSPDYQSAIRAWTYNQIIQQQPLPQGYVDLIHGRLETLPPKIDLSRYSQMDTTLRPAQKEAVLKAGKQFSILWGPPGTGKTYTLGSIAAALSMAGRRVLVIAPTNNATDKAALAIDDARIRLGAPLTKGEMIRPGRPSLPELEEREHLMKWTQVLCAAGEKLKELRTKKAALEKKRSAAFGHDRYELTKKLASIKEELAETENSRARELAKLAKEARIVVTTIATALYRQNILDQFIQSDCALIIDESSMVPRYVLPRMLSGDLGHLCLVGDFWQLGPICKSPTKLDKNAGYWVMDSIFDSARLCDVESATVLETKQCLTMLKEQNRMNPMVCEPISNVFYAGKLISIGVPKPLPLVPDWPSSSHVFVNFADAAASQAIKYSARNIRILENSRLDSALCAIGLIRKLQNHSSHKPPSILLITPFVNQARLACELLKKVIGTAPNIKAGTIHVAQGQEADVVIFDPVDPLHDWLVGKYKSDMRRLLNVAFSRAQSQVMVMGSSVQIAENALLASLCRNGMDWTPVF